MTDVPQTLSGAAERKAQRFEDARLSATLVAGGLAVCAALCFLIGILADSSILGVLTLGCALFSASLTAAAVVLSALRDAAQEDAR